MRGLLSIAVVAIVASMWPAEAGAAAQAKSVKVLIITGDHGHD
jgi:hypothetical protein